MAITTSVLTASTAAALQSAISTLIATETDITTVDIQYTSVLLPAGVEYSAVVIQTS